MSGDINTPQVAISTEVFEHPDNLSCNSPIVAKAVDPAKFFTTDVIIISTSPIAAIALFEGAPPDINSFLNDPKLQDYLGPQFKYVADHKLDGQAVLGNFIAENDMRMQYQKYLGQVILSIKSARCARFSYSIVSAP